MRSIISAILAGCLLTACVPSGSTVNMSASSAPIRGVGYAAISIQPGRTAIQKQLAAIRASRLAAMRELAEKIYGLDVNAYVSVSDSVMIADTMRGNVAGIVRSARTVSIGPVKADIYETILEVDAADVVAMMRETPQPRYR